MLHTDPLLAAKVTLRADGIDCAEYWPKTCGRDSDLQECFVPVRTRQMLSIELSLTGACREVWVDIFVDGIFRRLRRYVIDPPPSQTPFTDTVNSVWCRDRYSSKLYWTLLRVSSLEDFPRSGDGRALPEPGRIEIHISIPGREAAYRFRSGRTFEEDLNVGPHRFHIPVPPKKDYLSPTQKIAFNPAAELGSKLESVVRAGNNTRRPGSKPWAQFIFNYRHYSVLSTGNPGSEIRYSSPSIDARSVAVPKRSGASKFYPPISAPKGNLRPRGPLGGHSSGHILAEPPIQSRRAIVPFQSPANTRVVASIQASPTRVTPAMTTSANDLADAFLAREYPMTNFEASVNQDDDGSEPGEINANRPIVRLPLRISGRETQMMSAENSSDIEEAALRQQEQILKDLQEKKKDKEKHDASQARKASRKRKFQENESKINAQMKRVQGDEDTGSAIEKTEDDEPERKKMRGLSAPLGLTQNEKRKQWERMGEVIDSLKAEMAGMESKRVEIGKELGFF